MYKYSKHIIQIFTIVGLAVLLPVFLEPLSVTAEHNALLPHEEEFIYTNPDAIPESGAPHLPAEPLRESLIPAVIRIMLGLAGSLALISFCVGAFMLVSAQGNEDTVTKGKQIIVWSVIGLIVMSVSYAIIFGITALDFNITSEP